MPRKEGKQLPQLVDLPGIGPLLHGGLVERLQPTVSLDS